ncbi:hypothetical protein [Mucilaginibacter glaciei]|uniref:Uncharacterized protein n=1 Tax=Mucilaginibacter glaciei TaxID=2772109 RepID=A0A926NRX3_9SPHI|nr:hypothetical protein [Mucilaginibacter glaciei]MBD1393532.1 hypothetical protein [Mucilaginibacter glaciei]
MKESFSTAFPDNFCIPLVSEDIIPLAGVLFSPGTEAFYLLVEALKQEEKEKFGSPEITNLRFELKRFDPVKLNGRVRLLYDLQLTFSCSALVNGLNNQHSYWNFEIDEPSKTIYFEGEEYGDIRSTVDEF